MKNIVIASIIAIASATTASAYTCKNTAEIINGETVYTYSQCGNQAPASQTTLDQMSYAANNSESDEVVEEEVVVVPEVVAPVAPTLVDKLNVRISNLKDRKAVLQGKIKNATGKKKKALKDKRKKLNKRINKVTARIANQ
jgi:hypothetical protein